MSFENYGIDTGKLLDPSHIPNFLDISEPFAEDAALLLDQQTVILKGLSEDQIHWRENGYVIKRNFIEQDLIDEYLDIRK